MSEKKTDTVGCLHVNRLRNNQALFSSYNVAGQYRFCKLHFQLIVF
jgi:hypothetical protein